MPKKPVVTDFKGWTSFLFHKYGATDPIRTGDLLITSELLYLLSHSSILII